MNIPIRRLLSRSVRQILDGLLPFAPHATLALLELDGKAVWTLGRWDDAMNEKSASLLKETLPSAFSEQTGTLSVDEFRFTPILFGGQLCGVFVATGEPSEQHVKKLALELLGQNYEKRGLANEALERYRELNMLYRLGETFGRLRNPDRIVEVLLEETQQVLRFAVGLVVQFSDETSTSWVPVAEIGSSVEVSRLELALDLLFEKLSSSERSVILSDPEGELKALPYRCYLWVPIQTSERQFGGILLCRTPSEGEFFSSDEKMLYGLSWQAALALESAYHHQSLEKKVEERTLELQTHMQLLEEEIKERKRAEEQIREQQEILRKLSILDELTGLHNRRYLFEEGKRELAKARRYKREISVIMFDIDHFKKINDGYGHDIGDVALKVVSQCCLENLRESDLLCRYGGEEFVVILPETSPQFAFCAAERMREAVGELCIETSKGGLHVTFSAGISGTVSSEDTLEELLKRADEALYKAKGNGRNQCVIS